MAVYATIAQAEELYGTDYVTVACDRDQDGLPDTASLERHLSIASRQMDGYVLGRYALPLATPPEHFIKICVDIALYNSVPTQGVRTDEMRKRYDDAVKYMEMIAKNQVKLETSPDTTSPNQTVQSTISVGTSAVQCGVRGFPRTDLNRML
jgi:phage gp36-like protein